MEIVEREEITVGLVISVKLLDETRGDVIEGVM